MEETSCNLCGSTDNSLLFVGKDRLHALPGRFPVVKCAECGLIYVSPRPSAGEIAGYYPDSYHPFNPTPAGRRQGGAWRSFRHYLRVEMLARFYGYPRARVQVPVRMLVAITGRILLLMFGRRYLEIPKYEKDGSVFEVGCSTGLFLDALRELGWKTSGVEPNAKAAAYARERGGHSVLTGRFEDHEFPGLSFNAVYMNNVIEHLHDPRGALEKAHAMLKPGGILVVSTSNSGSIQKAMFGSYWYGWELPRHLYHFSGTTLSRMLERSGFKINKIVYEKNVNDIIWSSRFLAQEKTGGKARYVLMNKVNIGNRALQRLLIPAGIISSVTRQSGRMTVLANRRD